MATAFSILAVVAMVACLAVVPLGLPGVWGMVLIAGVGTLFGLISPLTLLALAGIAAIAEVAEFVAVKKVGDRYGASPKAFWGAVVGGIVGAFVGTPIPVLGSVVGVFVGTVLGAGAVSIFEGKPLVEAGVVGWGAFLGRTAAVALKGAAGVAVLAVTSFALFF